MPADFSSPRQSRGKQRKSYRVEDEYSFLDEEDGSAASGNQSPAFQDDDEDEDDFMPDAQEEEAEDDFEDEEEENDENEDVEEDEEESDDSLVTPKRGARGPKATPVKQPTTPLVQRNKPSTEHVPSPIIFAKGSGIKVRNVDAENKLRTRGVPDFDKIGGHEPRLKNLFGPDGQHLRPVLASRDYWSSQETFPIKKPGRVDPGQTELGGLRRSFFEKEGTREKESEVLKQWYRHTGKMVFEASQATKELSKDEAKVYMRNDGPESLNVLTGPVDSPQVTALEKGTYMHVGQSFPDKDSRRGWLFNSGSRIQDAQWATKEDSRTQYVAVAVEQRPMDGNRPKPMEIPKAPAFSATVPFPASIQIWAFEATEEGELDSSKEPRLELVVCANWGAPKQLRWCPVAAADTNADSDTETETHIGMLAVIWSDGRVRILNLCVPKRPDGQCQPTYLRFSHTAFEVSIPQTVPSCLQWLSGTTLAVATAAGTVAIWTLTRPGTLSPTNNPRPWFYHQLADTFILTISSAWPSNPHYLSISTADGFARLFDLRSPTADTTASIRGRTLCLTQAWHEHTQSFVMPDEHYILRHTPLRRYYHNLYSMRLDNSITRVATSPVHPGVLVGGTDGDVQTSNPVMRIANYKVVPWQQKWFVHEWRSEVGKLTVKPVTITNAHGEERSGEGEEKEEDSNASVAKVPEDILAQPLVRMSEGYKAVQQGIASSSVSKRKGNPEIGRSISIFEEKSAVTALAWNPSLKYGTWAVAGMGSGLLRVEDVGIVEKKK